MEILGLIPARAGSKSIPHKNTIPLVGRPMVEWVMIAGISCYDIKRVMCSTNDEQVKESCDKWGVEILHRPSHLTGDDVPVLHVILDVLRSLIIDGYEPDAVALLQPTSPFVTSDQISECIGMLGYEDVNSVQTVTSIPHNHHAWNQRLIYADYGNVDFIYKEEREAAWNKQMKPVYYAFGNLVVTKTKALMDGLGVFAQPSMPLKIPRPYAVDVDTMEDVEYAEWLFNSGKVDL